VANAWHVRVGDDVDYINALARWQSVKVVTVTDQNNLVLAYVGYNGSGRIPINASAPVPRRTSGTQVNVWRQH
jgi:hypothetical protein